MTAVTRLARRDERGITMIEVSIMLAVSLSLVAVLVPTLRMTTRTAERARTLQAMNAIQLSIQTVLTDLAYNKLTIDGQKNGTGVQLVVTDGDTPRELAGAGSFLWQRAVNNASGLVDFIEYHLVSNRPGNDPANAYPASSPPIRFWRGAYLTAPVDPDAWGNRLAVNVEYLGPSLNDVVVLSAGPNEIIETAWTGNPLAAGGDDVLVVVEP